jgi:regulator of replication initiation timing
MTEESFRQHLIAMEKENADLRLTNSQLRCNLSDKDAELQEVKRRLVDVEKFNETSRQKIALYEEERHELEREVFLYSIFISSS